MLLIGTLPALGVHLAALRIPFFQDILDVTPIRIGEWIVLVALAALIVVVMEAHKAFQRTREPGVA